MRRDSAIKAFVAWLAIALGTALPPAQAENWRASIYELTSPRHLVGVDKKRRLFNFFEKNSPFRLRYSYPCVTGQIPGDKQQINDLRTPEGIYFVEYKIAGGLDFREYGGVAYTLNYPNPVDRLRGKTGYGIWIHSKGFELSPTKGCVAIGLNNIAEVGPLLLPGTPVVLAEELGGVHKADDGSLEKLKDLMGQWSRAWAARSKKMFDFYDADAYSKATENFSLFRQNKERLFKILSFIKIYNREIHALEGPGYWVTWSEQFYTASNLSTEGVRRLYWQKDKTGQFRIVGMEWTPRDVGMRVAFQSGTLVAEGAPTTMTDIEAPTAPRLDMPEQAPLGSVAQVEPLVKSATPASGVVVAAGVPKTVVASTLPPAPSAAVAPKENSPLRASLVALAKNLLAATEPLVPRSKGNITAPDEIIWGEGKSINEAGSRPGAAREVGQETTTSRPALELPSAPNKTGKSAKPAKVSPGLQDEIEKLVLAWQRAYGQRSVAIDDLYDSRNYNKLPQSSGVPRGRSLSATLQSIKRDFRQPWLEIVSRRPQISLHGQIVKSVSDMLIVGPQIMRQGIQTCWWQKNDAGQYQMVGSDFKQESLGLEANYLDKISGALAAMVEDWRKAWETANLDAYISHYASGATQQGRGGAANIRRQKEQLWSSVRPAKVQLSGLRFSLDGSLVRADMTQAYADSAGRKDKGVKTLILQKEGHKWVIQKEDWTNEASAQVSPQKR